MDYEDKIYVFLTNEMVSGQKIQVKQLTNTPEKFIEAVQFLIVANYVTDIEFTENYKYIRKMWNF